ncbi:MAG TPA: hypothetical protein PLN52_24695 [Opitutaceae bacterium]|nr:hypothetical protein [Opitutaceae bacterium]
MAPGPSLPANGSSDLTTTQAVGDAWLVAVTSVAMWAPSALIPGT